MLDGIRRLIASWLVHMATIIHADEVLDIMEDAFEETHIGLSNTELEKTLKEIKEYINETDGYI